MPITSPSFPSPMLCCCFLLFLSVDPQDIESSLRPWSDRGSNADGNVDTARPLRLSVKRARAASVDDDEADRLSHPPSSPRYQYTPPSSSCSMVSSYHYPSSSAYSADSPIYSPVPPPYPPDNGYDVFPVMQVNYRPPFSPPRQSPSPAPFDGLAGASDGVEQWPPRDVVEEDGSRARGSKRSRSEEVCDVLHRFCVLGRLLWGGRLLVLCCVN